MALSRYVMWESLDVPTFSLGNIWESIVVFIAAVIPVHSHFSIYQTLVYSTSYASI